MPAAALAAAAALLLTACGSEGDKTSDNDKIAGADTGASASPSAASTSSSINRPAITLPDGVKDVFVDWKTGDASKDVALADAAEVDAGGGQSGDVSSP